MSEEWRSVSGFPMYEVSSLGRVRSYWRTTPTNPFLIIKIQKDNQGRPFVVLGKGDKDRRTVRVSVLVLESFVGPRPHKHEGAHENGDNTDNQLSNLKWKTKKDNEADKVRHGTLTIGERNGSVKLTDQQVQYIRSSPLSGYKLAKNLKVTKSTISVIRRNLSRKVPTSKMETTA
jgi:hypothetical protein